jgi:hypothetical protein
MVLVDLLLIVLSLLWEDISLDSGYMFIRKLMPCKYDINFCLLLRVVSSPMMSCEKLL